MASLSTGDTLGAIYHTTNNMSNKIDSVYDTLLERSRCTDAWEARALEYEGRYSTLMKRFDALQRENADLVKTNADLVRANMELVRALSKYTSAESSSHEDQQSDPC